MPTSKHLTELARCAEEAEAAQREAEDQAARALLWADDARERAGLPPKYGHVRYSAQQLDAWAAESAMRSRSRRTASDRDTLIRSVAWIGTLTFGLTFIGLVGVLLFA